MKQQLVEVIHGKHLVYEVIRNVEFFGTNYFVRMSNGKRHGHFKRLDEAVAWARQRSRTA
jgi:hypothetical protein